MSSRSQMDALKESFRVEAAELLADLQDTLIDLETNPSEPELTNRAFRALHSIKGSGAMFGFDSMSEFVHEIEDVFDRVRKGNLPVTGELIDATLMAHDQLNLMLSPDDEHDPAEAEAVLNRFRVIGETDSVATPEEPSQSDESLPEEPVQLLERYQITFTPPADLLRRGTDPVSLLEQLRSLGSCAVAADTTRVPPIEELVTDECYLSWSILIETDRGEDAIRDVFLFVDDDAISVARVGGAAPEGATETGVGNSGAGEALTDDLNDLARSSMSSAAAGENTDTIRVPSSRLDALVDLVGELVTVQARLSGYSQAGTDTELVAISEAIERLTDELRDIAMGMRMVPIGATFGRLRRLVRDLGRQLGKNVRLATSGDDTELDKTVIERLADPLVHVVRNALDHGIEDPAERKASGKVETGTIRLRAAHEGASVIVEVSDDGAGLDLERIRYVAEERGIIKSDVVMSEAETRDLIFAPGFSTSDSVTEVSGRGVGMDVVRRTVDSLGGSVEMHSVAGQGTTITLRLPLTLAIIEGLLVRVRDERYILPLSTVR